MVVPCIVSAIEPLGKSVWSGWASNPHRQRLELPSRKKRNADAVEDPDPCD
jgi:hypothetical protein